MTLSSSTSRPPPNRHLPPAQQSNTEHASSGGKLATTIAVCTIIPSLIIVDIFLYRRRKLGKRKAALMVYPKSIASRGHVLLSDVARRRVRQIHAIHRPSAPLWKIEFSGSSGCNIRKTGYLHIVIIITLLSVTPSVFPLTLCPLVTNYFRGRSCIHFVIRFSLRTVTIPGHGPGRNCGEHISRPSFVLGRLDSRLPPCPPQISIELSDDGKVGRPY